MAQQNDFRTYEKQALKLLLAQDNLEELLDKLQEITTADEHARLENMVLQNAGRLSFLNEKVTKGILSNNEGQLERNNIRNALTNIIEVLPNAITINNDPTAKPRPLMTEQRFKLVFLGLAFLSKVLIVLFTITIGASGLPKRDFYPIIFTQLPVFITLATIFYSDFIQRKNDVFSRGSDRKGVNNVLKMTVFILIPIFLILSIGLINNYSANAEESELQSLLSSLLMIETGFGVFVGLIVYGLFREK